MGGRFWAPVQLKNNPRVQQVLPLRTSSIPPHHLLHQIRTDSTCIPHHIGRHLQCSWQHLPRIVQRLGKEATPNRVVGAVRGPRGHGAHGTVVADSAGQEKRGTRFHDDAAAGEYKAYLGGRGREPDGAGECHGDADTDGGAVEGGDGGLAALLDIKGYSAAAGV